MSYYVPQPKLFAGTYTEEDSRNSVRLKPDDTVSFGTTTADFPTHLHDKLVSFEEKSTNTLRTVPCSRCDCEHKPGDIYVCKFCTKKICGANVNWCFYRLQYGEKEQEILLFCGTCADKAESFCDDKHDLYGFFKLK